MNSLRSVSRREKKRERQRERERERERERALSQSAVRTEAELLSLSSVK